MLSQLICFLKNLLWLLFNLISRWFRSEDKVWTQNLDVLIVGAGLTGSLSCYFLREMMKAQGGAVLVVGARRTATLPGPMTLVTASTASYNI